MSGEEVAKAFVAHFYSKFTAGGTQVRVFYVLFACFGRVSCVLKHLLKEMKAIDYVVSDASQMDLRKILLSSWRVRCAIRACRLVM